MEIIYNSHGFPGALGPALQGRNVLQFSVQELMWAAITVGRANFIDVLSHGVYSEYEILYRASLLGANIALNGNSLVKSSAYESLDPSEKGAVSYFFGLTFTKLLSNRLLNTPWLLHIDVYREQFARSGQALGFGSSRVRPDLIGMDDNDRWLVLESKGRTNKMENTLLARAKNQTRNLRNIGSATPFLRIGVVTHFTNGHLIVDWEDPEGYNDHSFDIETNREEYLALYYKLIFNILDNNKKREIGGYLTYTFEAVNLTVGLQRQIFDAYKSQNLKGITTFELLSFKQFNLIENQEVFHGKDGILIGLGSNWRELIRTNHKFDE